MYALDLDDGALLSTPKKAEGGNLPCELLFFDCCSVPFLEYHYAARGFYGLSASDGHRSDKGAALRGEEAGHRSGIDFDSVRGLSGNASGRDRSAFAGLFGSRTDFKGEGAAFTGGREDACDAEPLERPVGPIRKRVGVSTKTLVPAALKGKSVAGEDAPARERDAEAAALKGT